MTASRLVNGNSRASGGSFGVLAREQPREPGYQLPDAMSKDWTADSPKQWP